MKELYELKEKLCDELKAYSKREMSSGSLDVIDKLAHAIKNIDKIIENYDGNGYSNYYPNRMNYSMEKTEICMEDTLQEENIHIMAKSLGT